MTVESPTNPPTIKDHFAQLHTERVYYDIGLSLQGDVGYSTVFSTTETMSPQLRNDLDVTPDGYIIGVGGGMVWQMLDFFDDDHEPCGLIIVDPNISVILSCRILEELIKREMTKDEIFSLLLGRWKKNEGMPRKSRPNIEQLFEIAKEVAGAEMNPLLREKLIASANSPEFRTHFETMWASQGETPPFRKSITTNNTVEIALDRHWDRIVTLFQGDTIAFVHSQLTNSTVLGYIGGLPDIDESSNIIYFAHIIDHTRETIVNSHEVIDLQALQVECNQSGRSRFVYVHPHSMPTLCIDNKPPSWPPQQPMRR